MKSPFLRLNFALCLALCAIFFGAANNLQVAAQDLDDVTVSGKIIDANGAAVPGAIVSATLILTNQERSATTDSEGRYRLIELQPGTYNIRIVANGFANVEQNDLTTISGQNLQLNYTLTPASVRTETVTVDSDSAPAVDTTRTIVGGTLTEREIEELPNLDRSPLNLVFTLGGVAEEPLSARDVAEDRRIAGVNPASAPIEAGIFSLSGGAAYSNNITIDGLDNNDDRVAQERFQPSVDAIAEVQVITNQFSAEYGRASGGRVNIRTRAGTNRFRGRAFFFFRDEQLNANTYNNNRRGLSRLPFTEVNPGGTFSGPIPFGYFKNKTFFFSSYEFNNFDNTTRIDTVVPVVQNPLLPLPTPTGSPRNELSPGNAQIAPYILSVKTPSRNNIFTQRVDHNFTDSHNITFNYQLGRRRNFRQYIESTRLIDDVLQGTIRNTDAFYITDNYIFSPKIVNQFRFQYSQYKPDFGTPNPTEPVALITVRDSAQLENRSGTLTAGNSTINFATTREEKRNQFQDTLSVVAGEHSFKFGADVQDISSRTNDLADATGTFNFNSVSDFLSNNVLRFRRIFGTSSALKNTYYGLFVQDEWRALSNLTVSLGLRYENEVIVDDNNNFGPRAAIAYSPFGDNKGVIRVGGGLFYNRALLRTIDDYSFGGEALFDSRLIPGPGVDADCVLPANVNQPRCVFLRSIALNNVPTLEQLRSSTIPGVSTAFSTSATAGFTRLIDRDLKIPESYQFNVGFEREINKDFVFEANYTLNKTVRLWRETNVNAARVPTGQTDLSGDGAINLTDYLLGINTGTTRFELGAGNDANGISTRVVNGQNLTIVNLNSTNNSNGATMPIGRALTAINILRPNRNLTQVEQVGSLGRSFYQGLQLELRRRYRPLGYGFGASLRAVYTLSRLNDDGIVNTSSAQTPGDFNSEYSRGLQDRRHRFNFSGTFELPNYLAKLRVSPILRLASASPFSLGIGTGDRNLDDVNGTRPNFSGDLSNLKTRKPGEAFDDALLQQITLAPIGSPGNLPRNAGTGTNFFTFDMNVTREIRFTDRLRLRPNIEFDNVFNARILTFSSDFIDFNNTTTADFRNNFLVPQRALRPRQVRVGLRLDF